MDWLESGLKTDFNRGINPSSIQSRENFFGSNRKKKIKPKTLLQLMWEAFDDLILKILFVAALVSIAVNTWAEEDYRSIAWIEGFAILVSVFMVVFVTALNDLKKEKEFQILNEKAESGKKVTAIRNGEETHDLKLSEVLVGDVIKLESGNEIPGDGVILTGFSISIDESSMTGETKPMRKEPLDKCLAKKDELERKGVEKLKHNDIPSIVVMAGTKVLTGTGTLLIINVGKNSSIGKIQEIMTSSADLTPL